MTHTVDSCIAALTEASDGARAKELETKFGEGAYLGTSPQALEELARSWRQDVAFPERLELARALWASGIFDAQIMAAKLLTAARIKDDADVWTQLCDWLKEADIWPIVDALANAGGRRLSHDVSRMAWVETQAMKEEALPRRMALLLTLPLAKQTHLKEAEEAALDTACDWVPVFLEDEAADVKRTAESWVRSLQKHHFKKAKMIRQIAAERQV